MLGLGLKGKSKFRCSWRNCCCVSEVIISTLKKSVKGYYFHLLKKDKILQIRKKHSEIRHEYYAMANKYKSWDKCMLTFTIPSTVHLKTRSIKNGKYSKMRTLLDIKAYLAKLLSRYDNIKYFCVIELGKEYSFPHLHLQLWSKETTSAEIDKLRKKTIKHFNLNSNRCHTSTFNKESNIEVFHYIIKEYAKNLTDKQVWNIHIQRKKYRNQYGKNFRFFSKSQDKFTKKLYRFVYKFYGVLRYRADDFIQKLKDIFSFFTKKYFIKNFSLGIFFGKLRQYINKKEFVFFRLFFCNKIWFFSPSRDPPCFYFPFLV